MPLPDGTYDLESIRYLPGSPNLIITSEGVPKVGALPFISEITPGGREVRNIDIPFPATYPPGPESGIRSNLGFEGATVFGSTLSVLTESALAQDGPNATTTTGSRARLLQTDLGDVGGHNATEYVYQAEPNPAGSPPDTVAGNSEILALNDTDYLIVERAGNMDTNYFTIRVFWATTTGATPVTGKAKLGGTEKPLTKHLVFDFASIGFNPDNVEGVTFGPLLPDGRQSLVFVADDNFNPATERTQFHILAVG